MNKHSIGGESSSTAPPATLDHSSSVPKIIQMPVDLIAGLILPFVADRATWNSVCYASKELHLAGKNLTPPWPKTALRSATIVYDVAFSPSGSHLAFSAGLRVVHILDRWGRETILDCHSRFVSRLAYSRDGSIWRQTKMQQFES